MRRKSKIQIVETTCKRCGKSLCTLNRSLYGAESLKAELGSICATCLTPDEKDRLMHGVVAPIYGKISR